MTILYVVTHNIAGYGSEADPIACDITRVELSEADAEAALNGECWQ